MKPIGTIRVGVGPPTDEYDISIPGGEEFNPDSAFRAMVLEDGEAVYETHDGAEAGRTVTRTFVDKDYLGPSHKFPGVYLNRILASSTVREFRIIHDLWV